MHELSLVTSILEIAEAAARREGARTIRTVALRVGAFAGVDPGALEFAFEVAREGTMAERARLEIEIVPSHARCEGCDLSFELDNPFGLALCPRCGSSSTLVERGEELEVQFLEVV